MGQVVLQSFSSLAHSLAKLLLVQTCFQTHSLLGLHPTHSFLCQHSCCSLQCDQAWLYHHSSSHNLLSHICLSGLCHHYSAHNLLSHMSLSVSPLHSLS